MYKDDSFSIMVHYLQWIILLKFLFTGWSETKLISQSSHLTIQQLNLDNVAVQYSKLGDIINSFGDLNVFPNS